MRKNLFISNSKRLPWGLLTCVLLFVLTEAGLHTVFYKTLPPNDVFFIEQKKLLDGSAAAADYDGIMIGDSRMTGWDSQKLSDEVSAVSNREFSVANLACPYQDIRGYYLMLKKYLRRHGKPQVILFSSMPESLFEGWNINGPMELRGNYIHRFCLLFSLKDSFEVFPFQIFKEVAFYEIERYSYLITFRGHWRNSFEKKFNLRQNLRAAFYSEDAVPTDSRWLEDPVLRQKVVLLRIKSSSFNTQSPRVNEESYRWLRKFFALADKNGIPVFLLNAPINALYYEQREHNGLHERYRNMIRDFGDEFEHISIVQPLLLSYDLEFFRDDNHLNEAGWERYSDQFMPLIIEQIRNLKQ